MNEEERFRLRRNRVAITDDLQVSEVLAYLIQEGMLSDDDSERIQAEVTRREKASTLLDIIMCRGPKAYGIFRKSLEENYSWLVEKLDNTDLTELLEKEKKLKMNSLPTEQCTDLNHRTFQLTVSHFGNLLNWKMLARELEMDESDITEIEYQNSRDLKEQAYQMLVTWHDRNGSDANVDVLIKALRALGQNRCADVLEGKGCAR